MATSRPRVPMIIQQILAEASFRMQDKEAAHFTGRLMDMLLLVRNSRNVGKGKDKGRKTAKVSPRRPAAAVQGKKGSSKPTARKNRNQ